MTQIYAQHDAAFKRVSAYATLNADGKHVASVKIKYPGDGAGRLYAYTHWIGQEMTRGCASGYGYDKRSPAVRAGFGAALVAAENWEPKDWEYVEVAHNAKAIADLRAVCQALSTSEGEYWDTLLRNAGFKILNVI